MIVADALGQCAAVTVLESTDETSSWTMLDAWLWMLSIAVLLMTVTSVLLSVALVCYCYKSCGFGHGNKEMEETLEKSKVQYLQFPYTIAFDGVSRQTKDESSVFQIHRQTGGAAVVQQKEPEQVPAPQTPFQQNLSGPVNVRVHLSSSSEQQLSPPVHAPSISDVEELEYGTEAVRLRTRSKFGKVWICSQNGRKFHRCACSKMYGANGVSQVTRQQAMYLGMVACKVCKP